MLARVRKNIRLRYPYASVDETQFCARWRNNLELYVYQALIPMTALIDIVAVTLYGSFAHPQAMPVMRIFHSLHLLLVLAMRFVGKRPRVLRTLSGLAALSYTVGYGYVAYMCVNILHDQQHELLAVTGFLAATIIQVQACAFDKRIALGYCVLSIAIAAAATYGDPVGGTWTGIYAWLMVIAWYLYAGRVERVTDEAVREFRLRGTIAPAHIVRKTGGAADDLTTLFEPRSRNCICISSDWRNYQKITESLDPRYLASALNEYYNGCYSLLLAAFPDGNYYTDWIADELFVVVYEDGDLRGRELANMAVTFCQRLLELRARVATHHGFPQAADIGVASGEALVGMMGPDGFRKATAIGEVPGRARRLQTAGKLLRARLGPADRIILDHDTLMRLTQPFSVRNYDVSKTEHLRDLQTTSLCYVEPSADEQALTG